MKIPESRFSGSHERKPNGILIVVVIALVVALSVGVALFFVRSRTPILPISETEQTESLVELWKQDRYSDLIDAATLQLNRFPMDENALSLRGFARFYLAMQEVNREREHELLIGSVIDLRRVLLLDEVRLEPDIHYVLGKA